MKSKLLLLASVALFTTCSDDDTEPVTPPVKADFTLPTNGEQTIAVSFQNQSKNSTRYLWDFGDRSTSQDENPTHAYTAAGVYPVKLKAFGAEKNDSVIKSITISPYNIITRSGLRFAGSYTCKVIRATTTPFGPTSYVRLPDEVVTFTQQEPNLLVWNAFRLFYEPANPRLPQLPNGSKYTFSAPAGPTSPRLSAYVNFFTSGDSTNFASTEIIGHGSYSKIYHGIRRP